MLKFFAAIALAGFATAAAPAAINQRYLESLHLQATRQAAVPVSITLTTYRIQSLVSDRFSVQRAAQERAAQLLQELGRNALAAGRRDSGLGTLDLYVTSEGLQILSQTQAAVSFRPGKSWVHGRAGHDGRHEAIAMQLESQGYADVVLAFRDDNFDHELLRDGTGRPSAAAGMSARAAGNALALVQTMSDSDTFGGKQRMLAEARALASMTTPEMVMRVDLQGLLKLADSPLVRNIRPSGFKDARRTSVDAEAIAQARLNGTADVLLTIRNPYDDTSLTGAEHRAATATSGRIMRALLRDHGIASPLKEFPEFSSALVRLSASQLSQLAANRDPRILSVSLDKPVAVPMLSNSTPVQVHMGIAWSDASLWATGQNIVVMDTGVLSNHAMLRTPGSAVSRVTSEACFGTNRTAGGITWRSNCTANSGASFVAATSGAGTAAPVAACQQAAPGAPSARCAHGTHVASIAASLPVTANATTYRGVAHGASIAAYQVFSYDTARVAEPSAFLSDLLAAMQRVVGLTTPGTTNNPFTVNLSLGGGQYSSACPWTAWMPGAADGPNYSAFSAAVATLQARGVPVIAAAGNNGYPHSISWPACVPGVVKVASVVNDATGSAVSRFGASSGSNLANPVHFPGDTFWFAPGGGSASAGSQETFVVGANFIAANVNNQLARFAGTSQAAPHVAGMYAIVKGVVPGIAVDDIYPTLLNFGAVLPGPPFAANDCWGQSSPSPYACVTRQESYKMIRLP